MAWEGMFFGYEDVERRTEMTWLGETLGTGNEVGVGVRWVERDEAGWEKRKMMEKAKGIMLRRWIRGFMENGGE